MFPRRQLKNTTGKVLPWLVWKQGGIPGAVHDMRNVNAAWWAYIAPNDSERKLNQIADALEAVYRNPFVVAWGRTNVTFRGEPFDDDSLSLIGLEVRIGYRALG